MKCFVVLATLLILLAGCSAPPTRPAVTATPGANMPNPASAYCEQQGFRSEIRTAADGSQTGYCLFPDGSECDEWAYFRGECGPASPVEATPRADMPNPASTYCVEQGFRSEIRTAADGSQTGYCLFPDGSECDEWAFFRGECGQAPQTSSPTDIPTALPIDPADYQGWWTYTHPVYGFSILLPGDWVVEEITTNDPLMNHALNLHPGEIAPDVVPGHENLRMTFRHIGEDVLLWPTGVGAGEFIQQGTLDIAGQPARRLLLVCPAGDVTAIWYHDAAEGQPDIRRGDLDFGFIFSAGSHCDPGHSLGGKVQRVGEMIVASLRTP